MSTRTARRAKQRQANQPAQLPRAFRLGVALHPDAVSPPDFGAPKFTDEQQAADPTARMTRVVKPVLRTGDWKAGFNTDGTPRVWHVTGDTLKTLVDSFRLMSRRGYSPNLGKGHGDEDLQIHADDLIAPIDDVRIQGDVLWIASYVNPAEKEYLEHPSRKVSVGVASDYIDGGLQPYSQALLHVAVLDRGAVGGLAPFMALADTAAPSGSSAMDFPSLLEAINGLLEALGFAALPDDTSEENVVDRLIGVRAAMGETADTTTTESPPEGGDASMPAPDMSGLPAAMRDPIRKLLDPVLKQSVAQQATIKELSDKLQARDKADADKVKAEFEAECLRVQKEPLNGYVASAADVGEIKKLADSLGTHDKRLLATIRRSVKLGGGAARSQATPDAPPVVALSDSLNNAPEKRDAAAKYIAEARGITIEAARKFLPTI